MAIKFFNIKSKEVRVAQTEPQIAAMWASSDHSPNITQGQDFGWRLAPEVVVEMNRIKQDLSTLEQISLRTKIPMAEIGEKEILDYISSKTDESSAPVANDADYSDEYNEEIRRLTKESEKPQAATVPEPEEPTTTTTTTVVEPSVATEPGVAQSVPTPVTQNNDNQQEG